MNLDESSRSHRRGIKRPVMNAKRFRASACSLVAIRERPVDIHSKSRPMRLQIDDFCPSSLQPALVSARVPWL